MIVVTEWCDYIADDRFCLSGDGVLKLLSRTEVNLRSKHSTSECKASYICLFFICMLSIVTLQMYQFIHLLQVENQSLFQQRLICVI